MDENVDPVAVLLLLHLARRKLELAEAELRAAADVTTVMSDAFREQMIVRADQCGSTVRLIRGEIGDEP